jgi:hypothetical protein
MARINPALATLARGLVGTMSGWNAEEGNQLELAKRRYLNELTVAEIQKMRRDSELRDEAAERERTAWRQSQSPAAATLAALGKAPVTPDVLRALEASGQDVLSGGRSAITPTPIERRATPRLDLPSALRRLPDLTAPYAPQAPVVTTTGTRAALEDRLAGPPVTGGRSLFDTAMSSVGERQQRELDIKQDRVDGVAERANNAALAGIANRIAADITAGRTPNAANMWAYGQWHAKVAKSSPEIAAMYPAPEQIAQWGAEGVQRRGEQKTAEQVETEAGKLLGAIEADLGWYSRLAGDKEVPQTFVDAVNRNVQTLRDIYDEYGAGMNPATRARIERLWSDEAAAQGPAGRPAADPVAPPAPGVAVQPRAGRAPNVPQARAGTRSDAGARAQLVETARGYRAMYDRLWQPGQDPTRPDTFSEDDHVTKGLDQLRGKVAALKAKIAAYNAEHDDPITEDEVRRILDVNYNPPRGGGGAAPRAPVGRADIQKMVDNARAAGKTEDEIAALLQDFAARNPGALQYIGGHNPYRAFDGR